MTERIIFNKGVQGKLRETNLLLRMKTNINMKSYRKCEVSNKVGMKRISHK